MSRAAFEAWCLKEGINPGNLAAWEAWQAARNAALEEAAQRCEDRLRWIAGPGSGDMRYQVQQCAAAIRAMKEQPDKPLLEGTR